MRIAINALSAKVGSGPTFFRNFLPALAAHSQHEYCVLLAPHQRELKDVVPGDFETRLVRGVASGFAGRAAWEQAVLPSLLRRWRVDVLYSTGNVTTLVTGVPRAVAVTSAHPFSPLRFLWSHAMRLKFDVLRTASELSVRRATRTIFLSENSRTILTRRLGMAPERTAVIPYGCRPFDRGHAAPREAPYLLSVSVLMPHKNVERLMRAFDTFASESGFDGELVVAGPIVSTSYWWRLLEARAALAHGERIRFTGRIDQPQLVALYEHALAFAFPSLEETLGIPLQEAMGMGLPVAAGDPGRVPRGEELFIPCREVCEDGAIYFDPFDEHDIAGALGRIVSDSDLRRRLSRRGIERVAEFSWERTARETIAVLEETAGADRSRTKSLRSVG